MMDFDSLTPDAPIAQPTSPERQGALPSFDDLQDDSEKYGSVGQQAKTLAESAASGATLGLSKIAETKLLGVKPEDIEGREQANPGESLVGGAAGALGLGYVTGGLSSVLPEMTGLGGAAARIAAHAVEGAGYNAATGAATREAMGDPALDSQKIAADAGWGALTGGTLGTLFESGAGLAKAMMRAKSGIPGAADAVAGAEGAEPSTNGVVDAPFEAKTGVQPTSIQDIQARMDVAAKRGTSVSLPQSAVAADAISRVELENPVTPYEMNSLSDQGQRDAYLAARETPGVGGDAVRGLESLRRDELNGKTDQVIQDLSPGVKPTSDAVEGGNRASDAFTEQYQNEKNETGPKIGALNKLSIPEDLDIQHGLIDSVVKSVPGTAGMFDMSGEELGIRPYKTSWGIDRATYNAVKDAVTDAKGISTFEELKNIRNGLDQNVDLMKKGPAASQIGAIKSGLMDFNQDVLDQITPDVELRALNKRYAINEQERGVIEKVFGASVGTPEFGAISKIKPEYIGDKIFANTANVAAAKKILDPEKFNQILANWISEAKAAATKDGVFSSNKFGSWLTKNQDSLKVAFQENPGALQRLKDINTIARIFPDAPSINPSGTAKTLANFFRNLKNNVGVEDAYTKGLSIVPKALQLFKESIDHHLTNANIDAQLKGVSAANTVQLKIAKTAADVSNKIADNSKSIFSGGIAAGVAAMSIGSYDKNSKRIQELANDPDKMMDHMTKTTAAIHEAAPNVTQGLHNTMAKGVQFLNSKLPRPAQELPISGKWQPSLPQKQTFNRYYQTVDDPIGALKRVKNGTLNNQDMEALQTVHPDLLNEMRMNVMQNIQKEKAHNLPNGTKIAISKLLGQPVDENMVPSSIQANQTAYLQPEQPKITVKGTKNLNMAKRSAGETDSD